MAQSDFDTACGHLAVLGFRSARLSMGANRGDDTLLEMHQAFRRQGDREEARTALLPAARGHALEPLGAYWELKLRLGEASPAEIQAF